MASWRLARYAALTTGTSSSQTLCDSQITRLNIAFKVRCSRSAAPFVESL